MHALHRAGLPRGLSRAGRDRPERERHRRLPAGSVDRLRRLHVRVSFQRPELRRRHAPRLQVHAVRRSRRRRAAAGVLQGRPTSCLQFGTKERDAEVAQKRVDQLHANGFLRPASTIRRALAAPASSRCWPLAISRSSTVCRADPIVPARRRRGRVRSRGWQSGDARRACSGGRSTSSLRTQGSRETTCSENGTRDRPLCVRERLIHVLAALSFVYLLLTGLAFWTPALYWIAVVLGGGYLSRVLHPWMGLVFAGAVLVMFGTWWRDMRVTADDRQWRRAIGHYISNEDARVPAAGRFNYGQKMLFWVMVWAALVLLASGLVMWFVPVDSMGAPDDRAARARHRRARHDRRVHRARLHGHRRRARRAARDRPRRRQRDLGAPPPSGLAQALVSVPGGRPFRPGAGTSASRARDCSPTDSSTASPILSFYADLAEFQQHIMRNSRSSRRPARRRRGCCRVHRRFPRLAARPRAFTARGCGGRRPRTPA